MQAGKQQKPKKGNRNKNAADDDTEGNNEPSVDARRARKEAEYAAAYSAWVESLPPGKRELLIKENPLLLKPAIDPHAPPSRAPAVGEDGDFDDDSRDSRMEDLDSEDAFFADFQDKDLERIADEGGTEPEDFLADEPIFPNAEKTMNTSNPKDISTGILSLPTDAREVTMSHLTRAWGTTHPVPQSMTEFTWHYLRSILGIIVSADNTGLSAKCFCLAAGMEDLIDGVSQAQIAKEYGVRRATVSHRVKELCRSLGLSPSRSMKSIEQCEKYRQSRNRSLNSIA